MQNRLSLATVVVLLLAMPFAYPGVGAMGTQQAANQPSPADVAPFVGEWTLELEGPNGPGTFTLKVTTEKEKVTAEIGSEAMPAQPISTISIEEKSLVLGYSFTWEGNNVDAVVSLTPEKEGKTAAQIDFAGGAYVMTGRGTKKASGSQLPAAR
jgi:hypothetical protein